MCRTVSRHILTNYTRIDFAVIPENAPQKRPAACTLVNGDGEVVAAGTLRDYLLAVLIRQERAPGDVGSGEQVERIRLLPENLFIVDAGTGAREKVRQINLVAYSRSEEIELAPPASRGFD